MNTEQRAQLTWQGRTMIQEFPAEEVSELMSKYDQTWSPSEVRETLQMLFESACQEMERGRDGYCTLGGLWVRISNNIVAMGYSPIDFVSVLEEGQWSDPVNATGGNFGKVRASGG